VIFIVWLCVFFVSPAARNALLDGVEINHSRNPRNYYFAEIANNFRGSQAKSVPAMRGIRVLPMAESRRKSPSKVRANVRGNRFLQFAESACTKKTGHVASLA
jgi:formylmethanofuran dehydrogenase subunit E-like metal-binding protein